MQINREKNAEYFYFVSKTSEKYRDTIPNKRQTQLLLDIEGMIEYSAKEGGELGIAATGAGEQVDLRLWFAD